MGLEGVKSVDTEMGGAARSAGLADQDGQDGQGNFVEVVGSRVSGGMMIQRSGTSTKRIRSGKVVKYRDD